MRTWGERLPRILVALAIGLLAMLTTSVRGQVYGPPVPGSDAQRRAEAVQAMLQEPGAINPLEVLAGAGEGFADRAAGGRRAGSEEGNPGGLSVAVNILVVLTVIGLVPSLMLMCTCFVRILVVMGLLKQAIGAQSVPPPQVVTALALFMTLVVMSPTLGRINDEAIAPYRAGVITDYDTLWEKTRQPVRDFMFAQIEATGNWESVYMMLERRGIDTSDPSKLTRADVDMVSLVPAYMLSELKVAFLMGFRVYLPFLVIDLVISTMLISMSMMMLPPVLISLPFKLLLFVLVDGWALIVGSLMGSFAAPEAVAMMPAASDLVQAMLAVAGRTA